MKVQDSINQASKVGDGIGKDEKKPTDNSKVNFGEKLKFAEGKSFEERINSLVSKIAEQGEKLTKRTDIRELKIYKSLVSEFLDEALSNSQKFTKKNFMDRRGRHKVYAVVSKINDELDNLTKEVLNKEKDNINILKSLDDIRGLIMDIIL
jgi:uncharacterized protein